MKNRLEVAKEWLREDGFICIAIDHHELGYLIVLMDEIFGRENRVSIISILSNPGGRPNVDARKSINIKNEFILLYRKSAKSVFCNTTLQEGYKESVPIDKLYPYMDEKGIYREVPFLRIGGGRDKRNKNDDRSYPFFVNQDNLCLSLARKPNYVKILPKDNNDKLSFWKVSKKGAQNRLLDKEIFAKKIKGNIVILEKLRQDKTATGSFWINKKYNNAVYGLQLLKKYVKNTDFSYPKSLYAVLDILKLTTDKDDTILDFFAGSGTTGHAVLDLNKKDGGSRRFILIEQLEEHITVCKKRLTRVLELDNIEDTFVYFELAKCNQELVNRIKSAKTPSYILFLWQIMKKETHLNYTVSIKNEKSFLKEMQKVSLSQQKQLLIETLDLNQLYVSRSEMSDIRYNISKIDQKLTTQFYENHPV